MSEAPWVKLYTSDFLGGVAIGNMRAEDVGVYAVVLMLIAERGGPVENDREWLNRMAGTDTPRHAAKIVQRLIDKGKLTLTADGRLTNARMIEEIGRRRSKRDQASEAAQARWENEAKNGRKSTRNSAENRPENGSETGRKNSGKNGQGPQNSAIQPDADAYADGDAGRPLRARATQKLRDSELSHPVSSESEVAAPAPDQSQPNGSGRAETDKPDRLSDSGLYSLYQSVAHASGHNPSAPAQVDRAFGFVQRWRADGIDFDKVVIPTIKAVVSESREPTRTLGRFDARIRHEHARLAATPKGGKYAPPPSPVLEPDGEDPKFRPLRSALLEALGPAVYSRFANPIRLSETEGPKGKPVLKISDPRSGSLSLMDAERVPLVRSIAKRHGFADVW